MSQRRERRRGVCCLGTPCSAWRRRHSRQRRSPNAAARTRFPGHRLTPCTATREHGHGHRPALGPRHGSLCHSAGLLRPLLLLPQPPPHTKPPRGGAGRIRLEGPTAAMAVGRRGPRELRAAHLIAEYRSTRKARLRRTCSTMASMWPGQRAGSGGRRASAGGRSLRWAAPTFGGCVVSHRHHRHAPRHQRGGCESRLVFTGGGTEGSRGPGPAGGPTRPTVPRARPGVVRREVVGAGQGAPCPRDRLADSPPHLRHCQYPPWM